MRRRAPSRAGRSGKQPGALARPLVAGAQARSRQVLQGGIVLAGPDFEVLDPGYLVIEGGWITEIGTGDRKSTRLNSSHIQKSRMPSSA